MSDRFDEIFSLDRLRQNWKGGQEEKIEETSLPAQVKASIDVRSNFKQLKKLIESKYPNEKGEGLRILMQELEQVLLLRFPENDKPEKKVMDKQEKTDLNLEICEILNQMEDLMEALDIGD